MTDVSLAKCGSYDQEKVDAAVKAVMKPLGGFKAFFKKNEKVLLKPNLLRGCPPEAAVTTHPAVVDAVARALIDLKCEVSLGDSSFFGSTRKTAEAAGLAEVCDRLGVPIVDLRKGKKVKFKNGIMPSLTLGKAALEADAILNLPKLKTHSQMYYTCAVKNLFGCVSGPKKGLLHLTLADAEAFSQMLLDINSVIKPRLNLVDAVIGMEGAGPARGTPKKAGFIAAGNSTLAVDWVTSGLVGLDRNKIFYLTQAQKRSEFKFNPIDVKVVGVEPAKLKIPAFKPAGLVSVETMPIFVSRFSRLIRRSGIFNPLT
ncbi:Uncharacterised protein [uncultured archaeon]|nr:Uncharacterised protein [uncultured archaeon]